MEKQVSCFIFKQFIIVILCFYDQLYRFFPYFLGNFIDAFCKQAAGIGSINRVIFPVTYNIFQFK